MSENRRVWLPWWVFAVTIVPIGLVAGGALGYSKGFLDGMTDGASRCEG